MPPLVFAGEARNLQARLAQCAAGEAFMLQGGDCAESFDAFETDRIRDAFRVLLQMSVVMMYGGGVPIVKIGRMAGQFAKPRSSDMETADGQSLPSYRGDIINGPEFTAEARIPDPQRLVRAYNQSAATLNLLRGFSTGGYASLDRVLKWNLDFMSNSDEAQAYLELAKNVDQAVQFMNAAGLQSSSPIMAETEFYVSHEALLLDYEQALTRLDSTTGRWYDCSGHFLWCGERTRQLDGAHVEFMRGIGNPIGVKVSDKCPPADLVSMIKAFNPDNLPGRLAVVVRMGAAKLRTHMPALIEAVEEARLTVTWVCDPMHGNTETVSNFKTRRYENIRAEVEAFFDVHEEMGTVPGGLHLEMTGDNVTECIGGGSGVTGIDLGDRYHTHCDPRLNAEQALEMSFFVASRLRRRKIMLDQMSDARMEQLIPGSTA
jgi:3-deoxy-7-phosphoheptulonate synthase